MDVGDKLSSNKFARFFKDMETEILQVQQNWTRQSTFLAINNGSQISSHQNLQYSLLSKFVRIQSK